MSSLSKIVSSGIKWSIAAQIVIQTVKIGRWFLLLYFIKPAGFGLFALAVLLVSLPQILIDQGVGNAIIQSKKKFSIVDLSTYFWLLSGFCLFLFILSLVLAPFVATFFSEPNLSDLLIFLSGAFLIESLGKVSNALLRKELRFRYLAKAEALAFLLATSSTVFFAYEGQGAWALAYGLLVEYTLSVVFNVVGAKFLPIFSFSVDSLKKIYVFAGNISLIHFITLLMRYTDDLIIGFFFGKTALGIYDRAYQIVHLPMRLITNRIVMVLFPSYSQKSINKTEIRQMHLKILHYTAVLYFFILGGIILCTKYAVALFLPEEWSKLAFFIPVLAIGGVIHAFINYNYSIFLSLNRTDLQLRYGLITRGIIIIAYVIGAFFGVEGIAIGYLIGSLIAFYPESRRAWQEIGLSFKDFWKAISPSFFSTILIFTCSFILILFFERELIKLIIGSIFYGVFSIVVHREKFKEIRKML